jgi:uncharacterized membrane protein
MSNPVWPAHILIHTLAAGAALLVGVLQLTGAKGTTTHRALGWTWVALMAVVAGTSVLIRDRGLPNIAGYTPIHLFTVLTLVTLPMVVLRARRGDVAGHRRAVRNLFFGALVLAGVFTLLPSRRIGHMLWSALGLMG